jgi:hypothetical protein
VTILRILNRLLRNGCPPLPDPMKRYEAAGGRYYVCPICFNAKKLEQADLIAGGELQGTVPMWNWIGDEAATTFSYETPRVPKRSAQRRLRRRSR